MQEVEMPCADAPLKDLGHQQSVSPTHEPELDAASESDERARDERLREYGEFIARRRRGHQLILHQRVRYEERGPAVTKRSKQLRTWKIIRDLGRLGYRIESPNLQPSQTQAQ